MAGPDRRGLGRVFNEVPELYDRVRPAYPEQLFADLVAITGIDEGSSVLEVGCGTGQATRSLASLGCSVIALEPGEGQPSAPPGGGGRGCPRTPPIFMSATPPPTPTGAIRRSKTRCAQRARAG